MLREYLQGATHNDTLAQEIPAAFYDDEIAFVSGRDPCRIRGMIPLDPARYFRILLFVVRAIN